MFTQDELKIIAECIAKAQVNVGNAKIAVELLDKVMSLINEPAPEKKSEVEDAGNN